jgi:hypothetical protein
MKKGSKMCEKTTEQVVFHRVFTGFLGPIGSFLGGFRVKIFWGTVVWRGYRRMVPP